MWRNLKRDPRRRKFVAWRRRLESVCARGKGRTNPGGRASVSQSVVHARGKNDDDARKKNQNSKRTHLLLLNLVST